MSRSLVAGPRLLAAGLVLLVAAWMAATQPFLAPDEPSHYERAMILTNGQILGPQVPYIPSPGLNATQAEFIDHDTRGVWVAANLMPVLGECMDGLPNRSGCAVATPDGNFPPLGYVLPAAAIGFARSATTALWFTRVASALQSVAFVLLALALLWEGSGWSLLGLVAAVSPMVLFCASIMNPSGIEIASCLAFAAAGLRIARDPSRASGRVWFAFGLSGSVAALTGPLDVVFVLADLAVFAGLLGATGTRLLARRREARLAGAVVLVALALAVVYTRVAGFAHQFAFTPFGTSLQRGLDQFSGVLRGAIGDFGALTVPLPPSVDWLWWLLVVAVILVALWLGTVRERVVVGAVVVLGLAFPILFWAWVDRLSGFGLQGREVLPELMLIPLVAGEVVARNRRRLEVRRASGPALFAILVLTAGVQAYSWWLSAGTAGGAAGRFDFWGYATWSPPAGWAPWVAAACLGSLALVAYAAREGGRKQLPPGGGVDSAGRAEIAFGRT